MFAGPTYLPRRPSQLLATAIHMSGDRKRLGNLPCCTHRGSEALTSQCSMPPEGSLASTAK
jgi:hypothetical protein